MSLQIDIRGQLIDAMKSKDQVRLSVIRGLLSSFTNELVAKGRTPQEELSDEEVMGVIIKAVKQRKDSIEQYENGGRPELAENEKLELKLLQEYLPTQMSVDEIKEYIKNKISKENPTKEKSGQFIGFIMKELKGKADGAIVKELVDTLLN